jgi:uncharacterized hydrophobic protein (TIGR00271 family)
VVHLRLVVPADRVRAVLDFLMSCTTVINIVHLPGTSRRPDGDVVMCDVAREDASVILDDLRRMGLPAVGSVAVEVIDVAMSDLATQAEKDAHGAPADAVVWEELTSRTSESAELSASFLAFIVIAGIIAAVGILLNSSILIVGAMVVGPEFGPIAGFCVAAVQRRPRLALRSFGALAVGFPALIAATSLAVVAWRAAGIAPESFVTAEHQFSSTIASPDWFTVIVGLCAGVAGMLSLSTAKSGALVGVLISVTTVPAAANVAVSIVYGDGDGVRGSAETLVLNLAAILVGGLVVLAIQRTAYYRRRRDHRRRTDESYVRRALQASAGGASRARR